MITSSVPFGFADPQQTDSLASTSLSDEFSTLKETRTISISLHESIGIASNHPPKKHSIDDASSIYTSDHSEKLISFSESLDITTSIIEQQIHINSLITQPQTILDRVSQIDKLKDRKKNSKIDLLLIDQFVDEPKTVSTELSFDNIPILIQPLLILENNVHVGLFDEFLSYPDKLFTETVSELYSSDNFVNISFSETDHQYLLIIFTPFVFFLLLRSEGFEFDASKLHQPLAFVFTIIILSGGIITPISIGESYWSMAYADDSSFDTQITSSEDPTSSSSTPVEDTETVEDSTSTNTSAVDSVTNSTTISTGNGTTTEIIPSNGTDTVVLDTNSTGTEIPIILPNATESWQFDTQVNGSRFIGDVYIEERPIRA